MKDQDMSCHVMSCKPVFKHAWRLEDSRTWVTECQLSVPDQRIRESRTSNEVPVPAWAWQRTVWNHESPHDQVEPANMLVSASIDNKDLYICKRGGSELFLGTKSLTIWSCNSHATEVETCYSSWFVLCHPWVLPQIICTPPQHQASGCFNSWCCFILFQQIPALIAGLPLSEKCSFNFNFQRSRFLSFASNVP